MTRLRDPCKLPAAARPARAEPAETDRSDGGAHRRDASEGRCALDGHLPRLMVPLKEADELWVGATSNCLRMKLPVASATRPVPPVIVKDSTVLTVMPSSLGTTCPVPVAKTMSPLAAVRVMRSAPSVPANVTSVTSVNRPRCVAVPVPSTWMRVVLVSGSSRDECDVSKVPWNGNANPFAPARAVAPLPTGRAGAVGASGLREPSGLQATRASAAASEHARRSGAARCGDMEMVLEGGLGCGP